MAALLFHKCMILAILLVPVLSANKIGDDEKFQFLYSKIEKLEERVHALENKPLPVSNLNVAVAFSAWANSERSYSPEEPVRFPAIINNLGDGFDGEYFTCPTIGLYLFFTNLYTQREDHVSASIYVEDEGALTLATAPSSSGADNGSTMAITTCEAGQRVYVRVVTGGTLAGAGNCVFSGVQLAA